MSSGKSVAGGIRRNSSVEQTKSIKMRTHFACFGLRFLLASASPMRGAMLMECCEAPMAKSYDLDIEPDDIDVSDTVTIVWEIA